MSEFNPYVEWLGLAADLVEPNHYQILGLADFEGDTAKITIAADKAMSRVRGFRPGPNAKAWSKLLDELLLAKSHLLDAERKEGYDAELRETASAPKPAAASPSVAAPAVKEAPAWDPRFPPGMGPNTSKSQAAPAAPQMPTPTPAPAPLAAAPAPMPAAAWPTSMMHPQPHAAPAMPAMPMAAQPMMATQPQMAQPAYPPQAGYGQQPAPMAQPVYGNPHGNPPMAGFQPTGYPQPQYGQPAAYAPQGYAPQYGMPGYPMQGPQQPLPYGAPQYPPASYGMPSAPPPPPPVSDQSQPLDGLFGPVKRKPSPIDQLGLGAADPQPSYGPTAHSSFGMGSPGMAPGMTPGAMLNPMAPLAMPGADPMAPVAFPGSSPEEKQPRVIGFAAGQPATGEIPRGKAVSPASAAPGMPLANVTLSSPSPGASVSPLRAEAPPKAQDPTLIIICGAAGLLVVGALVFALANSKEEPEIARNPNPHPPAVVAPPVDKTKPALPKTPEPPIKPKVDLPKPVEPKPAEPKPKPEEMSNEPKPLEIMPAEPKPEMKPEPKPEKPIEFKPPNKNDPKPEMTPLPMPLKPAEPPPEMKLTSAEAKSFSLAMNKARQAMKERNFSEADAQLELAKPLAKGKEHFLVFERLHLMGEYVKQFDKEIKALFADDAFTTGAELTLGASTRVIVVEKTKDKLTIRLNASNKTYTPSNLPDGLAMALVDVRLPPNDKITKVIKGAWLATSKADTTENQDKAKALLMEAAQDGLFEISDLPLVMTDKYDFKE